MFEFKLIGRILQICVYVSLSHRIYNTHESIGICMALI